MLANHLSPSPSRQDNAAHGNETGQGVVNTTSQTALVPEVSRPASGLRPARWLRRKSLATVISESLEPPKPPNRTNDVRVSMGAVAVATTALFVPSVGLLTIPMLLYSARRVLWFGAESFLKGKPNTSTLVAIVIGTGLAAQVYLFSAIAATVAQYSYIVSDKVRSSARSSMIDIFSQRPKTVWVPYRNPDDTTDKVTAIEVPIESIRAGDTVIVHTSEVIPIDGTVLDGLASVDQHILTGESQPADKEIGDKVYASTVVMSGKLWIKVDKTGDETTVAQIGQILSQTLDFKAERQLKADEWADSTVWPTILASVAVTPFLGFDGGLTLVNAHYKRRMSLSAPISILNYFRILSEESILVKDGRTLDAIADVDTVVFDKTGTLTIAQPSVGAIYTYADIDQETILSLAATAEDKQSHPIALAILGEAQKRQLPLFQPEDTAYKVGYGLTVHIEGEVIRVGSLRFMQSEQLTIPHDLEAQQEASHEAGHSLVVVARGEQIIGAIELVPTVRPEAAEVVQWLKQAGIRETYIISGDHTTPTAKLAAQLGIDHYFAEVLPQDKAAIITELQAQGRTVAYIGDGINDSIALKQAAVSISLSGASAIAIDTAQVILMRENLEALPVLFTYGHEYDANLRNMFRYTAIAPMVVSLAFLPVPVVNLWVSLAATIYSLSGGIFYAMLPSWRYNWRQRQLAAENSHQDNHDDIPELVQK